MGSGIDLSGVYRRIEDIRSELRDTAREISNQVAEAHEQSMREIEYLQTQLVEMEKNAEKVYTQFVIETMEYLHKGGRCSGIARFAATVLRIKPIIQVREGKMSVQQKPIGKMKISLDAQINMILADKDRLDKSRIFVTHSIAPESEEYMVKRLKELFPDVEIIVTVAGCVISSHCGPGTIGVLYMVKEENN